MTHRLHTRVGRLEQRRARAAALGAEILDLLAEWEHRDPDAFTDALTTGRLAALLTPPERTTRR
ncbi:hypothetical protein [Streptomyces sp. BSP1]|uniref:hypothetical protein n=1 Tax=Streptomyces TaxID=1883 RepID=UPI00211DC4CD|nr:hypothetical protein [Streptomyces sp. BSP1]MCQ9706136.1 hypothetical protein [Streptomyces sp. BSP1]